MNRTIKSSDELENSDIKPTSENIIIGMSILFILLISFLLLKYEALMVNVVSDIRTWITANFNWYYVLFSLVCLVLCVYMYFGPCAKVKIGGAKAKPKYSKFAWYSMLFACGQGVGLIFWSVAEPILLSQDSSGIQVTQDNLINSLSVSYFHWAINAWAIYAILALALAYFHFNCKKPLNIHSCCEEILPAMFKAKVLTFIQIFTIISTMFGLITSFGFAALQTNAGINYLFATGTEYDYIIRITIISMIMVFTCGSIYVGINRGMRVISELNSILSISILVAFIVFGPFSFILNVLFDSVGAYLFGFIDMNFWTGYEDFDQNYLHWNDSWNGIWTIFIWSWCISFAPFVAAFIARISYGRTIKEFVFGVVVIPSIIVVLWIAIIGGTALYYDGLTDNAVYQAATENPSNGLFAMIALFDHKLVSVLLLLISTVLVVTYYTTSLNSGIHALSNFIFTIENKRKVMIEIVFVVMISLMTIALVVVGGESLLTLIQTCVVICSFPFSIIFLLVVANFIIKILSVNQQQLT